MFDKVQQSWELIKKSVALTASHKKLLVFPAVAFVCTLLMVFFFLAPVVLRPTGHAYTTAQHWSAIGHSLFNQTTDAHGQTVKASLSPIISLYLALIYFATMFLATFFNVALYHEILGVLNGQSVSLGRGLKFAGTRWKAVLLWSLLAGVVGLLIRQLEKRLGFLGEMITRFIGLAWSIASIFVIPIIVQEESNNNPILMLKNSAKALQRTWGEALIGYAGISFVGGLIFIVSIVLWVAGAVTAMKLNNFGLLGLVTGLWLLTACVLFYLMSLAGHIFKCALYQYANTGSAPSPYTEEMINHAWKFKKL